MARQTTAIAIGLQTTPYDIRQTIAAGAGAFVTAGLFSALNLSVCFAAGTKLLTPQGFKAIEDFKPGDSVLARSEYDVKRPIEAKVVEETFKRLGRVFNLHVSGKVIRTSGEHPFYVDGKGWIEACRLEAGDRLASHDGQWTAVEELIDTGEYETLYNLRVADYHTYFVGSSEWGFSVWAHNQCNNPAGQHGKVEHRNTVEALVTKAQTEFLGQNVIIQQGKSILGMTGVNRRPDVSVLDAITRQVLKVYEAARTNSAGFVPRELAKRVEYIAAGIASYFKRIIALFSG